MDMKTFKRMLSAHGADFRRWNGVDPSEVEAFMRESGEARAACENERKLDMALGAYRAGVPSGDILNAVEKRLDGGNIVPFPARIGRVSWKVAAGSGIAAAAAFVILISSMTAHAPDIVQEADVEKFSAEIAGTVVEDRESEEILSYIELASVAPQDIHEMDALIDGVVQGDTDPEIWEMFYYGP